MLTVRTSKLKQMISKAIKGSTNNLSYPMSGMINIYGYENKIELTTTDGNNFLVVKSEVEDTIKDEFIVAVPIDTFSKLVMKTTSEFISLEINNDVLKVVGNGTYNIGLEYDADEDEVITFTAPKMTSNITESFDIDSVKIKNAIATNESSLLPLTQNVTYSNRNYFSLTGYYMQPDSVISTDSVVITESKNHLFNTPVLVSKSLMSLLSLVDEEQIHIDLYDDGTTLVATSNTITIVGQLMSEIDAYPIDAITPLFKESYPYVCEIPKQYLIDVLDRMMLFIGLNDDNQIVLNFTENSLIITNKSNNASEFISYTKPNTSYVSDFICLVNIQTLFSQIKSHNTDTLEVFYGKDNAIKVNSDKLSQIILTLEDVE